VSALLNLPLGIQGSVELFQPEIVLLFLVPVVLLFPFAAMVISWFSKREVIETPKLSKEEKDAEKQRKKDLARKKREADRARRERAKAKKKRKDDETEVDEWDRALEESFKR
jgi:septal ring factor EnvC (AmiA/AmiB activator)